MPLYEFQCVSCGYSGEFRLAMGGKPSSCPECTDPQFEKQLTTFQARCSSKTGSSGLGKTPKTKPSHSHGQASASSSKPKESHSHSHSCSGDHSHKETHSCPGSQASSLIKNYEKKAKPYTVKGS